MHTIKSPVQGFDGEVVGVRFTNGVGQTDDAARLAYFRRQGYEVESKKPAKKAAPKPPSNDE